MSALTAVMIKSLLDADWPINILHPLTVLEYLPQTFCRLRKVTSRMAFLFR